jgi:hypothetical protein
MTIQEIVLILLKEAYDRRRKEGPESWVNVFEIGKKNGISEEDSENALMYLIENHLVKEDDEDGNINLNSYGADAYERRNMPDTPLYQLNQYVINAERAGDIQQGVSNIMNKLTYEQIFQKLELEITNSNLKDEEKKTLLSKLKELLSHPLIVELLKRVIFGQSLI